MVFDDDDFNDDDFNFEPEEESSLDKHRKMPIFVKAMEIVDITRAIVESMDEKDDLFRIGEQMMSNAYIIPAKIAGAEGGDLFSIRMDNAVLIKLAARELQAQTSLCKAEELCDPKYLQLLRDEIANFRVLFIEWVKSFDKDNDISDEWDICGLHE